MKLGGDRGYVITAKARDRLPSLTVDLLRREVRVIFTMTITATKPAKPRLQLFRGRYCCKSLFALVIKYSPGWLSCKAAAVGTTNPDVKELYQAGCEVQRC